MIYFYSHIIKYESLMESLDEMDLSQEQKKDLAKLIDSTLYHTILDLVLTNLSESDKQIFLKLLSEKKSREEIMEFLNANISNIDKQINEISEKLKKELHDDIKEAKRLHK